ncbi:MULTISPECIES: uroporphyrinogen-III synthase [Glaesserella]|uniref:Uroporphyrinogen-III synthase n=1 Tax=Glaesserella australis TaxID=2094024 RepID=A0A328BZY6_9PAST|nr:MULTISPECIES: uroporphyrinogen-III synthase [Glaesserella]AUI65330.1 uroporphyrinogen-III synthase [Glaesserella sp. 15-184]RAL18602.1 uroporphyrinogen-III synthase [Glaesserella australis]
MNVLVTRPDQRGAQLVELLAEQNIFALHQPLFSVIPGRELPQLPSAVARLNRGDYVFAVSKNAVDFARDTLKETGFHWRNDLNYFAVGQGTAQYFSSQIEQNVIYPIESENSEGLLALPEMQDLIGKSILILRADSGRELFPEQASLRGAQVQILECYQRIIEPDLSEQISLSKRIGVDVIVVTSGESLLTLFEQTAESERNWLFECRLVVVGQRIAKLAIKLGWQPKAIQISDKADNQSLLKLLINH